MQKSILLFYLLLVSFSTILAQADISGELRKWHTVTLTFDGPETSEEASDNPFLNYRLNVTFTNGNKTYVVPGYFAADGDAGNTSATSGNQWRVHFSPDALGQWTYSVDFRKGENIAVNADPKTGESAGFMDGERGYFTVKATDKTGRDFRAKGRLQYVGEHYLQFAETGEYFLKAGADAPENFLAYAEFDGDFKIDGHKDELVKTWAPHVQDWQAGDPTWQDGKGKGIIGALNYLASKGMNAFSFLTMNIAGDDRNVFPYVSYNDYTRMDVSKLAQWEMVFEHGQKLGLFLHFKTQEAENQGLLDDGEVGTERKLYYRELIARFGHHLALNWNLGEENGDWKKDNPTPFQYTPQRRAMTEYFYQNDPYHHHIVIHNEVPFHDLLGDASKLTGPSIQTHREDFSLVHGETLRWRRLSQEAGKRWVITVDEPGDHRYSLVPDAKNPEHDNARKNALWGVFMAGGAGIEWYFGYENEHSDLTCQDWHSRDKMWDQSRYALQFFTANNIPYWEMFPDDELTGSADDYAFYKPGEVYVFYLKNGGVCKPNMRAAGGAYEMRWYNPRKGKFAEKRVTLEGNTVMEIPAPPSEPEQDWVVLLRRK